MSLSALEGVAADPAPRMERALLERVDLLLGNGERLADRTRDHHRQPVTADGWSWHGREGTQELCWFTARAVVHAWRSACSRAALEREPRDQGARKPIGVSPEERPGRAGAVMHGRAGQYRDLMLGPAPSGRLRLRRGSSASPPSRCRGSCAPACAALPTSHRHPASPGTRRSYGAATARPDTRANGSRPPRERRPWRSPPAACPGPTGDPRRRRRAETAPAPTPRVPRTRWRR